ncbi:NAD(P)/FAD-dependent oxidoreductase [Parvularcula sp. ZS-1/3]|uniref:NAD(P)/FAD-dependent oxidoreductase n=1 Tax=Parvularcula mediterranea TaxID=2732508 RepID=A0A7Y3W5J2_9PROT|nr:NAD(P)/FAD-dependent oxidoreductase [Parvularcula mediterranea]NNU16341.1 NAD(P)/FAD-dependent oxidoreductase [Parvularcula mediterranea]
MAEETCDVVVIGAGLSGVGAASRLKIHHPNLSVRIFEAREDLGGTWDLFRYPGIRSDSDMYTLGYPFRPWHLPKSLTDGPSIKNYIRETAEEYGVYERIEFQTRVTEMSFNSDEAMWTTKIRRDDGSTETVRSRFVISGVGYYDYERGHVPMMGGEEDFKGEILEPQFWPEDLDFQDKKIAVIGSGATAVTIVPAMAEQGAGFVTMVQRSPTYIASLPAKDPWFDTVSKVLPSKATYKFFRIKRLLMGTATYQLSRRYPQWMKKQIRKATEEALDGKLPVEPHFTPTYNPWDQRFCLVPDNDLFEAIKKDKATVVTGGIDRFTEDGLLMEDGTKIEADIVVKATGLKLKPLSGMNIFVDGERFVFGDSYIYKGFMFSGIPNFAGMFGYTNASWTLKTDLASRYFCRLIDEMKAKGAEIIVPDYGSERPDPHPAIDLMASYVNRDIDQFPKQGGERPWRNHQSYIADYFDMKFSKLDDGVMAFRQRSPQSELVMKEAAE